MWRRSVLSYAALRAGLDSSVYAWRMASMDTGLEVDVDPAPAPDPDPDIVD